MLAAFFYSLAYWYSDGSKEYWRATTRYVLSEATPEDRILFANYSVRLFFEYYRRFYQSGSLPQPVYPAERCVSYETVDQTYESFDREVVDKLVA